MRIIYSLLISISMICSFSACQKDTANEPAKTPDNQTVVQEQTLNQDETITKEELPADSELVEITEKKLSFVAVGDNIIYGTKEAVLKAEPGGRKYNYKPYYEGVASIIENADISFINQETLMCGDGYSLSYYPMFNSPQELGYDIKELGFDIVNIANNHMLDKTADGLQKTIEFWKNMEDVLMIGGYENGEDFDNIRIYEKDGVKIAFLSYTYATNGLSKASSSPIVIPYINDEDIIRQTAMAQDMADLVFVSVHWGDEGSFTPNSEQRRVAQLFSDNGVDVIIGHHPHVIQPVEWIGDTLCVYSLGNFMAQQDMDYNMVGGMIGFDIVYGDGVEARIENPIFTPTAFHFNARFTDNCVYRFQDYTPEMAATHGVRGYYGNRFSYDTLRSYIDNTISDEFLPEFYHD